MPDLGKRSLKLMATKLMPTWLRLSSQVTLAVPMVGFFTQMLGSDYFKQYIADVMISVVETFGTSLIHVAVQALLFGNA
jgi:hypothetical protein